MAEDATKQQTQTPAKSTLTDEDQRAITKAISTTTTSVMNPVEYAQMKKIAADMIASKSLPATFTNTAQVQMALMAGHEMGMTTMESLNDLYFVGGKLQIYGKATPAALRRAGWRIKKFEETDDSCTATVYNPKTDEEITDTFTYRDAELSGFVKDSRGGIKLGWKPGANRKRKLRYAVLSQIIHTYLPEVLGSVAGIGDYSEDYMDAQNLDAEFRREQENEKRAAKLEKLQHLDESKEAEVIEGWWEIREDGSVHTTSGTYEEAMAAQKAGNYYNTKEEAEAAK
jgi:hypothetical protein